MPSTCVCPVLEPSEDASRDMAVSASGSAVLGVETAHGETLGVSGGALATLAVSVADSLSWNSGEYIPSIPTGDTYDGPTTVTPSTATQVLATNNKVVLSNITVNPIPSNYGLITWDGSTLMVS